VGYGIRKTRARKRPALPSSKTFQRKHAFAPPAPNLTDAIHFRAPENWRGRIKSKRVRKWFIDFVEGRGALAETDPGPGPFEVSVRISRRELNSAAKRSRITAAVLLRRLIASQIGPKAQRTNITSEAPRNLEASSTTAAEPLASWFMSLVMPTTLQARPMTTDLPDVPKAEKRLTIVTHVEGVRSLEDIDRAKRRGDGITFEELIRWRAVFERK
jgi:hypothetical protein